LPELFRRVAVVFAVLNGERECETAQSTTFGFVMIHSVPTGNIQSEMDAFLMLEGSVRSSEAKK